MLSAQTEVKVEQFNLQLNQFLNVRDFCISQDGKEAYFSIQSPNQEISQLALMRKHGNAWQEPILLPFCDEFQYLEPFLSADGLRLYFASNRPLKESTKEQEAKDFDIWFVERASQDDDWSKPQNMGKPVNSELNEFYPSLSDNNNLYFTIDSPSGRGKDDIYFSKWEKGKYLSPQLLSDSINSSGYEFNAFISKKEDFLLFTKYNEFGGQGSGDLYFSKKDVNGNWSKAKNLGIPINTKYMEYCPFYDEANKVLYFTSKRLNLEPKEFKTIQEFNEYVNNGENGLSKIYKTSLNIK